FTRLIEITLKHPDKRVVQEAARHLALLLRDQLQQEKVKVYGPAEPMIGKIRNQFLMTVLLKISRSRADLGAVKRILSRCVHEISLKENFRTVRVILDVDPV